MIALTGYNLSDYLFSRSLFTYEDLGDRKWEFIENKFSGTRNSNFVVRNPENYTNGKSDLFLKQPVSQYLTDNGLEVEIEVLTLLQKIYTLQPHVLKFVNHNGINEEQMAYDSDNQILMLKYRESNSFLDVLDGITDINRRTVSGEDDQLKVTKKLGEVLALFASELKFKGPDLTNIKLSSGEEITLSSTDRIVPWIINIKARDLRQMKESNSHYVERLGYLLCTDEIQKVLYDLRSSWSYTHLINSESSLSNVLVIVQSSPDIVLIDWEMAGCGPPLWQLAGIVAHFLSFTISENPPISKIKVTQHLNALFEGYFQSSSNSREKVELTVQYAGIILLQQYYQWASAYLHSGNSVHPDKFKLGKDCLLKKIEI